MNQRKLGKRILSDFDPYHTVPADRQLALYNKYRKLDMKLQSNLKKNDPVRYMEIMEQMRTIRMTLNLLGLSIRGINYNKLTGGM